MEHSVAIRVPDRTVSVSVRIIRLQRTLVALTALLISAGHSAAEERSVVIHTATKQSGELIHRVTTPYQSGETKIRVLLPGSYDPENRYRVIYVLPVEAKDEHRYGDGLATIREEKLPERHDVIFVAPTFSHLPWYADHPTDLEIRQETYLLKAVIPFIEETYPVEKSAHGRLLLGFSKSGWGAFSLLLRHPQTFGRAAAWDAPLMKDQPNQFGMGPIFGTQENFEPYQISTLLEQQSNKLNESPRLIITGYDNFREHHQQAHALLDELNIPHIYRDGPKRKHIWGSGWVSEAIELLLKRPE